MSCHLQKSESVTDTVDVCILEVYISGVGTELYFSACAHNCRHKVLALMLLLGSHSQALESRQSQNCSCFLLRACKSCSALQGSFCSLLEGWCCKSCVTYKKNWFCCLPSFISTNLRDVQIDFGLQPYLSGTSSFTKLLSCQHSPSLSSLPPPQPLHWAHDVVFLLLSLTVLHGKYLAADTCDRPLPGHVALPLSSVSTVTQRENCSSHGDKEVQTGLVVNRRI